MLIDSHINENHELLAKFNSRISVIQIDIQIGFNSLMNI